MNKTKWNLKAEMTINCEIWVIKPFITLKVRSKNYWKCYMQFICWWSQDADLSIPEPLDIQKIFLSCSVKFCLKSGWDAFLDVLTCANNVLLLPSPLFASKRVLSNHCIVIMALISYCRVKQVFFLECSHNKCILNSRGVMTVAGNSCNETETCTVLVVFGRSGVIICLIWSNKIWKVWKASLNRCISTQVSQAPNWK